MGRVLDVPLSEGIVLQVMGIFHRLIRRVGWDAPAKIRLWMIPWAVLVNVFFVRMLLVFFE